MGRQQWVPWDALAYVWTTTAPIPNMPRELSIHQALALLAHHPNAITSTGMLGNWGMGGSMGLVSPTSCGDVMVTESEIRAPAEYIARQIHYYWATPHRRAYLSDQNIMVRDAPTPP